jgi:FkbM family methyltransferase
MTDASGLENNKPSFASERSRIEMTVSCRDADSIPKVQGAGMLATENGIDVQIMHNGVRVIAGGYDGAWMMEIIQRLAGHHEPQEEAVFYEVLKHIPAEGVILEIGGHWSYYSLWFMHDFPGSRRAFVIEPDPNNLAVGRQNAAINRYHISFIQGFVGFRSEVDRPFRTESAGTVLLPMICGPDFLASNNIHVLDLLHCDSQGAELTVIQSCETFLRMKKIKFVVVSTHVHFISGDPIIHQRCLHLLREFGGRILAEHDVHESFSGDGLIVAYFGREAIDWRDVPLSYNRYSTSLFRNPLYDLSLAQAQIARVKAEIARDKAEITNSKAEIARLNSEIAARGAEIAALRNSTSWRVSAPIRWLGYGARRLRSRTRI